MLQATVLLEPWKKKESPFKVTYDQVTGMVTVCIGRTSVDLGATDFLRMCKTFTEVLQPFERNI